MYYIHRVKLHYLENTFREQSSKTKERERVHMIQTRWIWRKSRVAFPPLKINLCSKQNLYVLITWKRNEKHTYMHQRKKYIYTHIKLTHRRIYNTYTHAYIEQSVLWVLWSESLQTKQWTPWRTVKRRGDREDLSY